MKPPSDKTFTAARIRALKPGVGRYWVPDAACPGLYIRVQPSGEKSYYVRGRIGSGRSAPQRNVRLGNVRQVPLADARTQAHALIAQLRSGIDPTKAAVAPTIRELIDRFSSDLASRGVVNVRSVESSLRRNLEKCSQLSADQLSRSDFVEVIAQCQSRSGPAAATAFRGFAAAMLNWAVNSGALRSSVLAGYKAPRRTKAQRLASRDQYTLTGAEGIRNFWAATEAALDPVFRDYLRFLILTGQRRSETAAMAWSNVSDDRWTIPAEVTKTGREQVVPLGPVSGKLLATQVRRSDLVWPGRGNVPMAGWSKRLLPVKAAMSEPRLAMHALRRGYRTGIRELGADEDLCEIMIGHARRGLIARYDKSEMWDARVAIQNEWEKTIEAAIR